VTAHGYPLSLHLEGKKCLVVGAGEEAAQRERSLVEAGARVQVLARDVPDAELDDTWLVVQTSIDTELAADLARRCDARRIFFCAVDQPQHSSYSHMALARAGSLTLAIGTEGRVPALGRRLRVELERLLDDAKAASEVERLAALRAATPAAERREVLARALADVRLTGELQFKKP
jgi:siroheme synthase (precorrin-2 oxidase/ferrochelatase)